MSNSPEYQRRYYRRWKKKRRLKKWVYKTLISIFGIMLCVNLLQIVNWDNDNKKITNIKEEIEENIEINIIENEGEMVNPPTTPEEKNDYWDYITVPFYDVDFNNLFQKNIDTVAFINVKNTNINYPIVQTNDNDFYLTHAYDKTKNEAGWIFLDYRNNKNFEDDNTIIYGHGRLNKTVFGSLKDLLSEAWQQNKENHTINVSTPTNNYIYQIFSIYTIESESYYITPYFSNESSKEKWINTMKERNTSIINTEVNSKDKVITLSTCLNNNNGRIVVHAKLIKKQTKETAN